MRPKVFLDTSYALAVASQRDFLHYQAVEVSKRIKQSSIQFITTRAIIIEIVNALSKIPYRHIAQQIILDFERDPNLEIVPLTEHLYQRAFQLFQNRMDKEWGLTDCISFVVMRDYGITEALTADTHFQQAGFVPLLNE